PAGPGGPLGTEFEASLLRYIAANLGVSYEQLSRDYSNSNYSSVRAALTETWRYMQSRKRMTADRFASYIFRLWLEEAIMKNQIDSFPLSKAPMLYEGGALNLKFEALTHCDWIGASRGQIDELKETQAAVLRLKYNLSTDEMELARQGLDFRQVYKQRAREKKMREALGIEPELKDNMMNATTGAPRDKSEPGSGGGGETGADTGDKTND
ncbi:MAG TPA: phage portal protein, partial [Rhizobium sp.]|nr:phage portal protein [Rhizobium sp.]